MSFVCLAPGVGTPPLLCLTLTPTFIFILLSHALVCPDCLSFSPCDHRNDSRASSVPCLESCRTCLSLYVLTLKPTPGFISFLVFSFFNSVFVSLSPLCPIASRANSILSCLSFSCSFAKLTSVHQHADGSSRHAGKHHKWSHTPHFALPPSPPFSSSALASPSELSSTHVPLAPPRSLRPSLCRHCSLSPAASSSPFHISNSSPPLSCCFIFCRLALLRQLFLDLFLVPLPPCRVLFHRLAFPSFSILNPRFFFSPLSVNRLSSSSVSFWISI